MSRNTSITLGDHLEEYAGEQVKVGRYGSVSEVVRAGVRLLELQEQKLNVLRNALVEGEESGKPEPFNMQDFLNEQDFLK